MFSESVVSQNHTFLHVRRRFAQSRAKREPPFLISNPLKGVREKKLVKTIKVRYDYTALFWERPLHV